MIHVQNMREKSKVNLFKHILAGYIGYAPFDDQEILMHLLL